MTTTAVEPVQCDGCPRPIFAGMHYMRVVVVLRTVGEEQWTSVDGFTTFEVVVHHPGCFLTWAAQHPVLVDVFGDIGRH